MMRRGSGRPPRGQGFQRGRGRGFQPNRGRGRGGRGRGHARPPPPPRREHESGSRRDAPHAKPRSLSPPRPRSHNIGGDSDRSFGYDDRRQMPGGSRGQEHGLIDDRGGMRRGVDLEPMGMFDLRASTTSSAQIQDELVRRHEMQAQMEMARATSGSGPAGMSGNVGLDLYDATKQREFLLEQTRFNMQERTDQYHDMNRGRAGPGAGEGRYSTTDVDMRQDDYYDDDRPVRNVSGMSESSPEYYSMNYPTTELDEMEYAAGERHPRYDDDDSYDQDRDYHHRSRSRSRSRSQSSERYRSPDFSRDRYSDNSAENERSSYDERDRRRSPSPNQYDRISPEPIPEESDMKVDTDRDERDRENYYQNSPRRSHSRDRSPPQRNVRDAMSSQLHSPHRKMERESSIPKYQRGHSQELERGPTGPREHGRSSRSRSSSLSKEVPGSGTGSPVGMEKNSLDTTKTAPLKSTSNTQLETKLAEDEGKSLFITVKNDQFKGEQKEPVSALDRLGPVVPTVPPASKEATEQRGPLLSAGLKRKPKAPIPENDDFDLYADIPPPSNEDDIHDDIISQPKQDLVITFQPKQEEQPPVTTSEQIVSGFSESAPPVIPVNPVNPVDHVDSQVKIDVDMMSSDIEKEKKEENVEDVPIVESKDQEPTIVTIPKSKWDSDDESTEKHIVLVPQTVIPPPKVEVKKEVKKRDPSLHMGQIVKDIRYGKGNQAKKSGEGVKGKAEHEKRNPNDSKKEVSDSKKQNPPKKEKHAKRSRSRSKERKSARETDKRRDDRHRTSERRDRERDRHRYSSSSSRDKYSRERSGSRYGSDRRGDYKSYRERRYDRRSDDRRSGSPLRGRNRFMHDRRRSRSRSRSRSSSYSSSSSRSSRSSSSRSSSSSSSSPSRSREREQSKPHPLSTPEKPAAGKPVKESSSPAKVDESAVNVTTEYDIFSGNIIITRKLEENVQPSKKEEEKEKEKGVNRDKTSKFGSGGLSDPLGLKQLTKKDKSKIYSGPIIDMPPLTVTATSAPESKPVPVPLTTAKPLKSILKKKKTPTSDAAPVSTQSIAPGIPTNGTTTQPPSGSGNGVDLAKISSFLATLVPAPGQSQGVAQVQNQLSQLPGNSQSQGGFMGTPGASAVFPGLGDPIAQSASTSNAIQSILGALSGDQLSSLPGLGGHTMPSVGIGGIATSSITSLGGIPSATLASVPPSVPGLGHFTSSSGFSGGSDVGGLFPSANILASQSVSQQSNVGSLPGLTGMLGGFQDPNTNFGQSGIIPGLQAFNSSAASSGDIPFLTDSQSENQHTSLEDEDRFLYGEPSDRSKEHKRHTQVTQEEYVPEIKPTDPQIPSSVDPNQIQNILAAIGFDFDMAKKIAIEKEKGQQVQDSGQSQTQGNQVANKAGNVKTQTSKPESKANIGAPENRGLPIVDYKLDDLNQTASFLDTGLQMPDSRGNDGSAVKTKKTKKKKEKTEKKKGKKDGKASAVQKKADEASNDRNVHEQQSSHNSKKKEQRDLHGKEKHVRGEKEESRRELVKSEEPVAESYSKMESSSRRQREEPVEVEEQYHETQRRQSRYPADLANIKIQVAQEPSDSQSPTNRRIVLLPPEHQPLSYEEERYIAETQPPDTWEVKMQQLQEEEFHRRKKWEATELRRVREELKEEYRNREAEEKERRRREMLKKEQEWLMREVALKTMEEKIRREEEKLLREKEARRREDHRRDEDKQYRLKKDKEEYQKKLGFLEKELERLRKQQGEIMRRKQRQKDGHKDPQLEENNQLQDEITNQIRFLRKAYSGVVDRDSERGRRDEKDDRNRRSLSTDRSSSSKDERDKDKGSSRQGKRDSTELKQEGKSRFGFVYFDPGNHWCKVCQKTLTNLDTFFVHLHSKRHMQNCDPHDRPWLPSDFKPNTSTSPGSVVPAPARGAEFVMPVNGFYCRLCKEFFGDGVCAAEHIKDPKHNLVYQKFTDENKQYERQLKLEKATCMANQLANQARGGSKLYDDIDDDDDDDYQFDERGTKRKSSTSESETRSKLIKKEEEAVKITGKQKGGFGKFEFDKEKEKGDKSDLEYGPALPVELRKETSTEDKAQQKKDPNKLTIKIGASKRLIPSALLRAKSAVTTSAPAQPTETTTASEPEVTIRQTRSTRSTAAALRSLPMIGKRPMRKAKEVVKESPKDKEPPPLPTSSLELFLQVGGSIDGGGKALPIIQDDKEEQQTKDTSKIQAKDTSKEQAKDTSKEQFVLKESDIASAFKGEGQSDAEDAGVKQDNTKSEDEMDENPPVPGAEDADGDQFSLPKPIPPPPAD